MIVGGNIDGVTRVMTTAIALETSKGDLPLALALGLVLLVGGAAAERAGARCCATGVPALICGWRLHERAGPLPGAHPEACRAEGRPVSALPVVASRVTPIGLPLVELQGVSVVLGGRTVLDRIDLAVRPGERIALVGANGAGKTTLLRALHGLVPLARGSARPRPMPTRRACDGVPAAVHAAASLLANIELGLRLQGLSAAERREIAMHALDQVGLAARRSVPARALSGGEQQRAALARAWALKPHLLLLDEPTASLDPSAKREVEDLIDEFVAQGITVVMSSHNLGQVKRLSRRVLYVETGRVLADVETDHFFHGTLPAEAALFLKGELPWV